MIDLLLDVFGNAIGVPPDKAFLRFMPQPIHGRPTFGHHFSWIEVTEIVHGECAPFGDLSRSLKG